MHSQLIDAYKVERRIGTRRVQKCIPISNCGEVRCLRQCRRGEDPFDYESYTYYVTVSEKTDGLLGLHTCTWNQGDRPDDRQTNFLYGDTGRGLGGGTGYNHAEMVYATRRYSAQEDPYPLGSFRRGDDNPPMRDARVWVERDVFE